MSLYSGKFQRSQYQGGIIGRIGGALAKVAGRVAGLTPVGRVGTAVAIGKAVIQNRQAIASIPPRLQATFPNIPIPGGFSDVTGGGSSMMNKNGTPRRIRQDGKPYKQPRMNPANPRALKRSIRRVLRFGQLARAVGYGRPPKAVKNVKRIGKSR